MGYEIESVAAVVVVSASKLELDSQYAQCADLDSAGTHLHSEVNVVKLLRVEIACSGHDVEKIAASVTNTATMRDEAVKMAYNLRCQIAAGVCCEDAYKLEVTAVEEGLVETRVERAILQWSGINFVLDVLQAFLDHSGALYAVVESSNCLSENVEDKVNAETSQALTHSLSAISRCMSPQNGADSVGQRLSTKLYGNVSIHWCT